MNRNDLFRAMECIDEKMIENSEVKHTVKNPKKFTRRTMLLVAALCLLLAFTTVALATNLFGLRDMLVPSNDPEIKNEMVLSGYTDSSEYMAAAEWKAFVDSYDPDNSILAQIDPAGPEDILLDEKYIHYNVYTPEMGSELDRIAAKYGLTLYGNFINELPGSLVEKLIVNDDAEFTDSACNSVLGGYMFDDGTFHFDGIFDATAGRLSVNYQFRHSVKGVFDPTFLNIGDIETYQEQALVTSSGVQLMASLSEQQAVLIAELDDCFISINVMGGTQEGITFDDLRDLANTFDFSVIENGTYMAAEDIRKTDDTAPEQIFIEVSREGNVEKIPVEIICLIDSGSVIATAPEYFTHSVQNGADIFSNDVWQGEHEVYYSVRTILGSNPNQICEELMEKHGKSYTSSNVFAVKVGRYDGTAVLFENEAACQRHFFIIPAHNSCTLIEAQFDVEMYEGLYQIMLALFDTLEIG